MEGRGPYDLPGSPEWSECLAAGYFLERLAGLEELDELLGEAEPLPEVDGLAELHGLMQRNVRDAWGRSLTFRLTVASEGLAADAKEADAAAVAIKLAGVLREHLKPKLVCVELGPMKAGNSSEAVWRFGRRRRTWRLPSEALAEMVDDQWAPLMRGDMTEADALLADVLAALGQAEVADDIRKRPLTPVWVRWVAKGDKLPAALALLVRAAWESVKAERERAAKEAEAAEERRLKVGVPSMHGLTAAAVLGMPWRGDTHTLQAKAEGMPAFGPNARSLAAGVTAFKPAEWERLGNAAALLAAHLARAAHEAYLADGQGAADVRLLASEAEMRRMGLDMRGKPGKDLEELLGLLMSVSLTGPGFEAPLVSGFIRAEERRTTEKGGRPGAVYIVTVGWPLRPAALEGYVAKHALVLPPELVWYGPVLNPAHCVLLGNARTYRQQRTAYAIGFGQWLVSQREEYAKLGGVRVESAYPFVESMGLYHRTHASLRDEVVRSWTLAPAQLELGAPTRPLLVPTRVAGVYRLGPDYQAQEALILDAASRTEWQRERQARGAKKRRGLKSKP